ncbi:MAG: hypothetical protein LQ344_004368 [Seirophora lacunosa]|nr:MAG: hypothetical protein LQ344_004368 [Seirophora lacunosa]
MESPLKRRRLFAPENLDVELNERRNRNYVKLKSRFESIFEKYSKDFSGVGDEIDFARDDGDQIVVDNGHLFNMTDEQDPGDNTDCPDEEADVTYPGQIGDGALSGVILDSQGFDSSEDDPLGTLENVVHAKASSLSHQSAGGPMWARYENSSGSRKPRSTKGAHLMPSSRIHQTPITSQRSGESSRFKDDSFVEEAWRVPLLPIDCAERPCLPSPSSTDQGEIDSLRSASPPGVSLWAPQSETRVRYSFTEDEDELLRYCRTCTNMTWAATCALLPGRHCATLQRRWQILNRDMQTVAQVDDNEWTSEEGQLLRRLKMSSRMSDNGIQRELPRHSRAAIAYHWHVMCQRHTEPVKHRVSLSPSPHVLPSNDELPHRPGELAPELADTPILSGEASSDQSGPRLDDATARQAKFPPGTVIADSQGGEEPQHALEQSCGPRVSLQERTALHRARAEDDKTTPSKARRGRPLGARPVRLGRPRVPTTAQLGKRKRVSDKGYDAGSANTRTCAHDIGSHEIIVISSSPEPEIVSDEQPNSVSDGPGNSPKLTNRLSNDSDVPAGMETAGSIKRPNCKDAASKAHPRRTASPTHCPGAEKRFSRLQQSLELGAAQAETSTAPSKNRKVIEDLHRSFAKSPTHEAVSQRLERKERRGDVRRTGDAQPRLESSSGYPIFEHLRESASPARKIPGVPLCRQLQNPVIQQEDWERIRARVQSQEADPDQEEVPSRVTPATPAISLSQMDMCPPESIPERTLALESKTLADHHMVDVLGFDDPPPVHVPYNGSEDSTTDARKAAIALSHHGISSGGSTQSPFGISLIRDGPELAARRHEQSIVETDVIQEPPDKTSLPARLVASPESRSQTNKLFSEPTHKPAEAATTSCLRFWYVEIPGPSPVEPLSSRAALPCQERNEDSHLSSLILSQGSNSEIQKHDQDVAAIPETEVGKGPDEPRDNQQSNSQQDLPHSPPQTSQDRDIVLPTMEELGEPSAASGHPKVSAEVLSEDPYLTNENNLPGDRPPVKDSSLSHEQMSTKEDHHLEKSSTANAHPEPLSGNLSADDPSIAGNKLPGHSPPIEDPSLTCEQTSTNEDDQDDLQLPSQPAMTPIRRTPKHRTSDGGAYGLAFRPKIDEMDLSDDELSTPLKMKARDRLEMTPVPSVKSSGRRLTWLF